MKATLSFATCFLAGFLATFLLAADPDPYTRTETTTIHTTVEAIDRDARTVTVRDRAGQPVTLSAGPDVERFDDLKVGDEVTFRYIESVALQIHRLDQPGSTSGSRGQAFRGSTELPEGAGTRRITKTVTIEKVDPDAEFITFTTEDGRRQSVHPDNRSLLKDLHRGDRVEITYTTAMLLSIDEDTPPVRPGSNDQRDGFEAGGVVASAGAVASRPQPPPSAV